MTIPTGDQRVRDQYVEHAPLAEAPVKRYVDELLAGKSGPPGQGDFQYALGGIDGR